MKVYEYIEYGNPIKWCYQVDNEVFKTDLRHSMKSLKNKLNCDSLSVQTEIGAGILYGNMRFSQRSNRPNYNI